MFSARSLEYQDLLQAKDDFYRCVDSGGQPFSAGSVPERCQQQRSAFEAACKASWVC